VSPKVDAFELLLHDPVPDLSSWSGLRSATTTALHRGKLDTYLWWSYAKGARQQLLSWSSSISTVADAEDATEVVISCAKARVETHTGIYSSWTRAVGQSLSTESVLACHLGMVAETAAMLSRAGLLSEADGFWSRSFPRLVARMAHKCPVTHLPQAAVAYALGCDIGSAVTPEVFEPLETQFIKAVPAAGVREAVLFLWAVRRVGRQSSEVLQVVHPILEDQGHLSLLEPLLLCALAQNSQHLPATTAVNLLRSLGRRAPTPEMLQFLCRGAGALATRGFLSNSELWSVVEVVGPRLGELSPLAQAELLKAAILVESRDEALLQALLDRLETVSFPLDEMNPEEDAFKLLPNATELGPIGEPSASLQTAVLYLESKALLRDSTVGNSQSCLEFVLKHAATLPSWWAARVMWALRSLEVDTTTLLQQCQRYYFCEASEVEELLRLLPVLPLDCSTSLDIAGKTAQVFESALESGRLSLKQGAHGILSLALMSSSTSNAWASVTSDLQQLPSTSLMQLSLAALLEAGSEGADSLDLTRLHQLLTEMPKETGGANHMLLQLLEAIFSKLQVPWPAAQPKAGSIDDHSPSWLIASEASRRTHAWLWLLLKDPGPVKALSPRTLSVLNTARRRLEDLLLEKTSDHGK